MRRQRGAARHSARTLRLYCGSERRRLPGYRGGGRPKASISKPRVRGSISSPPIRMVVAALVAVAARMGIASLRAPLMALRAARAIAALDGRTQIEDDDVALAATLTLSPRATRLPEAGAEEEPEAEPEDAGPPERNGFRTGSRIRGFENDERATAADRGCRAGRREGCDSGRSAGANRNGFDRAKPVGERGQIRRVASFGSPRTPDRRPSGLAARGAGQLHRHVARRRAMATRAPSRTAG